MNTMKGATRCHEDRRTAGRNRNGGRKGRATITPSLLLLAVLSLLFSCHLPGVAANGDDESNNGILKAIVHSNQFQILSEKRKQLMSFAGQQIMQPIKDQYQTLSPKGKFFSTAFVGFTAGRVTVKTTIQVAKYAGAAFIISEVLNSAGVLDSNEDENSFHDDMIQQLRTTLVAKVNDCRLIIRKHCSMERIKIEFETCLQNDRIGTLGFTSGAVAALIL